MVTFTLTFSHKVNGVRQIFTINGVEAKVTVEADGRVGAMEHESVKLFCEQHQASVRMVNP